jgi:hypothetical protein
MLIVEWILLIARTIKLAIILTKKEKPVPVETQQKI